VTAHAVLAIAIVVVAIGSVVWLIRLERELRKR
jgi:hypothetical protein